MDKVEARELLQAALEPWRHRSYGELCREVGRWQRFETTGHGGAHYEGTIEAFWADAPNGAVKVVGSIDDGGWRTFVAVTQEFIVVPDRALVGE